jgi:hypothetical protein
MRRIPLPLESYQYVSKPLTHKALLNFFAEQAPDDSRTAAALVATPGLEQFSNLVFGTGPVTALNTDFPGLIYAVSGTHFWRAQGILGSTALLIEDLGEIGAPTVVDYAQNVMVTIAAGVTGAVVCVPPNAFTCTHSGALNQIGGDFPGASSVTYIDGYFVFTSDDINGNFFTSRLLDPTDYDALDFAFTDAVPNVARRVMTLKGELWFLGDLAVEIWYNAGLADFPFRRRAGGVIAQGAHSIKTAVVLDGSMFWVGRNGIVFRSVGYKEQRISTHSVEEIIRTLGAGNAICGLGYVQGGHTFYCLTYAQTTLVYDVATKMWAERSSAANSAWLPISVCQYGEVLLFGSSNSGRVFTTVPFLNTDDGVEQNRIAALPPLWAGTSRAFCARLEIEMELGLTRNPAYFLLQWSDDGGYTWTDGRTMNADSSGNYRKRIYTTRLGSFRQRMFRLSMVGYSVIYGVDADIRAGTN